MSEKNNVLKRLVSLCLILALVLPAVVTVRGAGKEDIRLSGSFLDNGSYRVSCETYFENLPPTAEIKYEWTYKTADNWKEHTLTTSESHFDFFPEEISREAWCTCRATASYNLAFSLINDAYLRFLHRKTDTTGYDTWKSTLLNHTAIENTRRVDDCIGEPVASREISGIIYQLVFSDEYLSQWNPEAKGYVRQNPVPFMVDGKRTKNTPEQLIYDCYLYLLGKEPPEAEIQAYLKNCYNPYKDRTGSYGLAGGVYTINLGMTKVINAIIEHLKCDDYLFRTYDKYDIDNHQFTYTEDDITVKEEHQTTDISEKFCLPAKYTVRDYLQTEDCKGWELETTETFYEEAGAYLDCADLAVDYNGLHYDHAESGGKTVGSVTVAANNSTVISLYYKRDVQVAEYSVSHYQLNLAGTAYELAETETFTGTVGESLLPRELAKSYEGFTFLGGKVRPAKEEPGSIKAFAVPVSGFISAVTVAQGRSIALFYDRNQYTVSLSKDDAIKSVSGAGNYFYGESVKVSAEAETSYRFTRWADSGRTVNGKNRSFFDRELAFPMPANDVSLTAYGQQKENHLLTLDPNGGTLGGSEDVSEWILAEEESLEIDYPELPGFKFNGWDYLYGDGSLSGDEKTFTMGTDDTYLKASWYPAEDTPYTVNHYKQELDGSYTLFESETKEGTTGTPVTPQVKQYEGFTSPAPEMLVIAGSGKSVLNYYYGRNRYAVRFDGNGANQGEMGSLTLQYGERKALPENAFTRFGFEFDGWNTSPDGSGEYFADRAEVVNLKTGQGEEITLYAVWYDLPFISAPDRYFSIKEAQDGKVTEEELLSKAFIDGPADGLHVKDYDAAFWTSQSEEGEILVTYEAVDSKGRPISAKATIYLVNTYPVYDLHRSYSRFIAPKYWRYEDGERAGELVDPEDGGVEWWSIWRNNPEYRETMDFSMELAKSIKWGTASMKVYGQTVTVQTEEMTDCDQIQYCYYFTHEDVLDVKKYVAQHGLGNALEPHALGNFMDQFDHCRKREREYLYDPVSRMRVKKTED